MKLSFSYINFLILCLAYQNWQAEATCRRSTCIIGMIQRSQCDDLNTNCSYETYPVMNTHDGHMMYSNMPYCTTDMQSNCKVCYGNTYEYDNVTRCCKGVISKDNQCYEYHHIDVDGTVCDKEYFKLNATGHCYLAYPYWYYADNGIAAVGVFVIVSLPIAMFTGLICAICNT